MNKEKDIMKKDFRNIFLIFFIFYLTNIYSQKIPTNNEYLKVELRNDGSNIFIRFKNTTNDTISFRNVFFVESDWSQSYIKSYEKVPIDSITKDSIYERGFLMDYYPERKYSFDTKESPIKIPPKTIKEFYMNFFFRPGKYHFEIKTFYIHQRKFYFIEAKTNEIKIE